MWANREVVARDRRSGLHMDYTAVGQTTHLAGRTEQFDEPGTILLAPATLALCQTSSRRRLTSVPVPIRSAPTSRRTSRGLTKFVGRASELAQLGRALEFARGGRGHIVAVVGAPGIGKSRLFRELAHSHRTYD